MSPHHRLRSFQAPPSASAPLAIDASRPLAIPRVAAAACALAVALVAGALLPTLALARDPSAALDLAPPIAARAASPSASRAAPNSAAHLAPRPASGGAPAPGMAAFMKIKAPTKAALAPDGTLYFLNIAAGVRQLYQCPAGRPQREARPLTAFEEGIDGYALSPDGRWAVVTVDAGGDENAQLHLVGADGSTRPLTAKPSVQHADVVWRRDSKAFAFRANDPSPSDFAVHVYDLEGAASRTVLSEPGYYQPVDFSADGTRLLVFKYVSAVNYIPFEVDLESGSARRLSPASEEGIFFPIGYGPGDDDVIVQSDSGRDKMGLVRLRREDGRIEPLTSPADPRELEEASLSADRSLVAIVWNEEGYGTLELRSLPEGRPVAGPEIPKGVVSGASLQGRTLLFCLENAREPGIFFRASLDAPAEPPVAVTEAELYGVDLSRFRLPQLVHYRSADGLEIPAFLYLPADYAKGKPIPFLVQFHGGPELQFRPDFVRNFQYFLSRGFGILAPNVRGSAGYGTEYMQMDNGPGRIGSVRDGIAAAEWLIAEGHAERGRIGVYGTSYGGYMTMAMITEAPDLWGAACNAYGIVNLVSFLEGTEDYRRAQRETEYGPLSDPDLLHSVSPLFKADRITAPLMLAYGHNDPRVPFTEALQIAVALQKRGVDVEQLYFPDEGHGFLREENRVLFYERLARFFERHLLSDR